MEYTKKNERWVYKDNVQPESGGENVTRRVMAWCDDMMCVENTFATGAIGPLHSHPHTQITYVASGVFEFTIEGETHTVKAGDTLLKMDGVEHGCTCTEAGILVDFFNPHREDFVAGK